MMKRCFCLFVLLALHDQAALAQWLSQISGTENALGSVNFVNARIGTAVGALGTIIRTTNGGTQWTPQTSVATTDLFGVYFAKLTKGGVESVQCFGNGSRDAVERNTVGGTI